MLFVTEVEWGALLFRCLGKTGFITSRHIDAQHYAKDYHGLMGLLSKAIGDQKVVAMALKKPIPFIKAWDFTYRAPVGFGRGRPTPAAAAL